MNQYSISSYQKEVKKRKISDDNQVFFLGLIGEVGDIATLCKKKKRDYLSEKSFKDALRTEIGDVLWYLTAASSSLRITLHSIANGKAKSSSKTIEDLYHYQKDVTENFSDEVLILNLAKEVSKLYDLFKEYEKDSKGKKKHFKEIFSNTLFFLANLANHHELNLGNIALLNMAKTKGLYDTSNYINKSESTNDIYEKLPKELSIEFVERQFNDNSKHVILVANNIIIGDRLTDNSKEEDWYRYHDVFHLCYMTFLGWSPVMRTILKRKRKSDSGIDEVEDGGRAKVIEEAVSIFIFTEAQKVNFFKDIKKIEQRIISIVKDLTKGLEVSDRTFNQWEKAILEGYRIFNLLKLNKGGVVKVNLQKSLIEYKPKSKKGRSNASR